MAESRKMSSVAIIGAGPSGLISAHHLRNPPPSSFSVTIFEKTNRVCGLWPTAKDDNERMIDPLMRANQSRCTVQFGATGQRLYENNEEQDEEVDMFPKAWQIGRYLSRLCDEVTAAGAKLELSTEVVSVEKVKDGHKNGEIMKWRVRTRKNAPQAETTETEGSCRAADAEDEEHIFDHVIIASGIYGTPKIPANLQPFLSTITSSPPSAPDATEEAKPKTIDSPLGIPVIHSSNFRSLAQLLPSTPPPATPSPGKRKILIVGGSMSGAEMASAIASELSSHSHSPGPSSLANPADYEVIHVATRPFYTLPRYLPLDPKSAAPTCLPCDLVFNNLVPRRRAVGVPYPGGLLKDEEAKHAHARFLALSGLEKPHAWSEADKDTDAPWLAICDDYTPHALSGHITTVRGRLAGFQHVGSKDASVSAVITAPHGEELVDDVAAVILATGFSSTPSLSFMSENMREKLAFIPDSYNTLILSWQSTISRSFPTLGFVGMYTGPFWGVMEQQALLLRDTWTRFLFSAEARQKGVERENHPADKLPYVGYGFHYFRKREDDPSELEWQMAYVGESLSQFPMWDYVHTMWDLLNQLRGMNVDYGPEEEVCWPLVPDAVEARQWLWPGKTEECEEEARRLRTSPARRAVQHTVDEGMKGKFYPRTLFRALLGRWILQRTITSKHPSYPSGTLNGIATFYPRNPTADEYSAEYLYDESGDFKTENGLLMRASRRYVWRLKSGKGGEGDKLEQWFVKVSGEEKNVGVDYLFHGLDIVRPDGVALSSPSDAACPLPMAPGTPGLYAASADDDGDVRGGWASKAENEKKGKVEEEARVEKAEEEREALWTAKGHHLCIDDTYEPEYVFRWKGAELESWTMAYTVKGPGKDYFIESRFTRPC